MRKLLFFALILLSGVRADAVYPQAVYQYAVPAKNVEGKEIKAFLWVPPEAERVRGVLIGGQTLMETQFSADPLIRRVCAAEQLAIVLFNPSVDSVFDFVDKNAGALLQSALDDLAKASGYHEIKFAPLFSFGHSVSTIFARNVAFWQPQRCFGVLLFKGGMGFPANAPNASILGVPILQITGQFEEFGPGPSGVLRENEDRETAWKSATQNLLALRARDPRHLISLLVEPGATHYAWAPPLAAFVAEFIREAARQRIPDWPVDAKEPVICRDINPQNGALSSGDIKSAKASPYREYQGEAPGAFWHLSLSLAQAADKMHQNLSGKKAQFLAFADTKSGKPISVGHDMRVRFAPQWTGADSFEVAGVFLEKAPDKYPKSEEPAGHAPGDIQFAPLAGPLLQVGPRVFRIAPNATGGERAILLAFHPGDATYRWAEQHARVNLPARLTKGQTQSITFPAVGPLKINGAPLQVPLRATSDSGLPVRYYVESGPAVIENGTLKLQEIPRRAAFPLQVTVVAYQFGSAVEPFVQSAEPVKQSFAVEK